MPTWPDKLTPSGLEWRLVKAGVQFRSPFTGSLQGVDFVGDHWEVNIAFHGEGQMRRYSGELEATLMWLAGGVNTIDIYHWVRPMPRGTMRGTPTLQVVTTKGATQIVVTTSNPAVTLLAGDLIGIDSQVVMVRSDCIASGTTLTVPLVNHIAAVYPEGTPIIWNRPTITVKMAEGSAGLAYRPGMTLPSEVTLVQP